MEIGNLFSGLGGQSATDKTKSDDTDTTLAGLSGLGSTLAAVTGTGTGTQPASDSGFDLVLGQVMQQAIGGIGSSATLTQQSGSQAVSFLSQSLVSGLTMAMLPTASSTESAAKQTAKDSGGLKMFADGNTPSLGDFIDIVNPLQHIPVVDRYYQKWTGDEQGYVPQMLGSTLYGGALGAATTLASIGATEALGKNPVDYVTDKITGDDTAAKTASTTKTP
ncbi:hypothetical protein [Gallaecimonas pentaromativorans]|uniref:Uncharacterized protein n=1 Tax=Gallaecimonas pentaromativorans TaxID=584787 RepID=A0A3N1PNQ8_9GAMM|nr:hypothetical protein [Gallaecimonas pentaromativorans]ROQ28510.1 hypothetical protein EDC28_103103 [Gallaecimonas pentaromativorans]